MKKIQWPDAWVAGQWPVGLCANLRHNLDTKGPRPLSRGPLVKGIDPPPPPLRQQTL